MINKKYEISGVVNSNTDDNFCQQPFIIILLGYLQRQDLIALFNFKAECKILGERYKKCDQVREHQLRSNVFSFEQEI